MSVTRTRCFSIPNVKYILYPRNAVRLLAFRHGIPTADSICTYPIGPNRQLARLWKRNINTISTSV